MRKPKNIMPQQTRILNERLSELGITVPTDYRLFVTKTNRGRHSQNNKNVTVPLWAYEAGKLGYRKHDGNPEYAIYYASHELAHIATPNQSHGPAFMTEFKRICPEHLWKYEILYKPRNAMAAGISL